VATYERAVRPPHLNSNEDFNEEMDHKDFGVTRSLFLEWRSPRFGQFNPTRMDNKVWEWLIRSRKSAYHATQALSDPGSSNEGPTWCFDRMGQTATELPDGRTIYIGGEHEDFYDPDFYIYNDVIVIHPDESVEIYGYPEHIFPPTDFHTSTLIDNTIVIIGSLGYREKRSIGDTQVYLLDLASFEIQEVKTTGTSPGWIHQHTAMLTDNRESIKIAKGILYLGENRSLIENIDDWKLNLRDWRWERLTERKWTRWELKRRDHGPNHLWNVRQALFDRNMNWEDTYKESIKRLTIEIGKEPDLDLINVLYSPDVPHSQMPQQEYNVFRISVDGVIVRYVEDLYSVQVTVEGNLPEDVIEKIKSDVLEKFSLLENSTCDLEMI
jgi:hypothetical protein